MMISSSISVSFAGGHVDWTANTSRPRTLSSIRTPISPSANRKTLIAPTGRPRYSPIPRARSGLLVPLKIRICASAIAVPASPPLPVCPNSAPLTRPAAPRENLRAAGRLFSTVERADDPRRHADCDPPRRHVLRHHGSGARRGPAPDAHGRDQHRVAPDIAAVADRGPVFAPVEAVIAGDRAGTDVDLGADERVPEVTLVVHLRPVADAGVLQFGEVSDLDLAAHHGARTEVGVRTDPRAFTDPAFLDPRVPHTDAGPEGRGVDACARAHNAAGADHRAPGQERAGMQHGVAADLDGVVYEGGHGIEHRDPGRHQPLEHAAAQDRVHRG